MSNQAVAQKPSAPPVNQHRVIDDLDRVVVRGSVHPLANPLNRLGPSDPQLPMERMTLVLERRTGGQAELEDLIAQQHNPSSPFYHQWLTPAEFGKRFGISDTDLVAVEEWLSSYGFVINGVAEGRGWINFSGTVDQVQRAFQTTIDDFWVDGKLRHANSTDPSIPRALADVVLGVLTLHNFPKPAANHLASNFQTGSSRNVVDSNGHHLGPADFAKIYDVQPLLDAGINGSGQSIAIVGRSEIRLHDVQLFRSSFGLAPNDPVITINGPNPLFTDAELEGALDVEWAGAVAPNATIIYVASKTTNSADGVDLSAEYIVDNNTAPIMNTSYGQCETTLNNRIISIGVSSAPGMVFYNHLWSQAASQGITSIVSAGDAGAADCNDPNTDTTGSGVAQVSGLCSTPFNICVGGTQFDEASNPNITYWSSTGSALQYIPERTWNESGNVSGGSGIWATGGGASGTWRKPSWQVAPNVPPDDKRYVPDVALSAAAHDSYMIVQLASSQSVKGTSASAPAFAGIMALVLQKTGQRQGNANTVLYPMAQSQYGFGFPTFFHDITTGNNSVPGVSGFTAGTGYDQVTGLGSVDAATLVNGWGAPSISTFTVTPSSASLGAAFTATATVSESGGLALKEIQLWRAPDANGVPGTWGQVNVQLLSGTGPTTVNFQDSPSATGSYWYGAHLCNSAGTCTVEPQTVKITVVAAAPALPSPVLRAPSDGAIGISTSPTLLWDAVNASITGYRVMISTSLASLPTDPSAQTCSAPCSTFTTTTTSSLLSGLLAGTSYYWQVKSFLAAPVKDSAWTRASFTTAAANRLPAPVLNAPQIIGTTAAPQAQFSWSQVANNSGYRIMVSETISSFPTNPDVGTCVPSDLACTINESNSLTTNITTYTSQANILKPGTTYYWQVHARASAPFLPGYWSTVSSFTTPGVGSNSIAVTLSGSGSVTSSPAGINCPNVCTANFAQNTQVTLSAAPSAGWSFVGWGGACGGTGACLVTVNGAQSVFANFAQSVGSSAPTVVTGASTSVTTNSATLTGTVNPNGAATSYWFEYGTSSVALTSTTGTFSIGSGTSTLSVSAFAGSLTPNTTYFFRIVGSNAIGTTRGSIISLTTQAPPSVLPSVTTASPTNVAASAATLNGTVNPNGSSTSYWFEYGTDSALATFAQTPQQSLGAGLNALDVNWPVPGLSANTTYFFRVAAQNGAGTIKGSILSFTTTAGAVSCNTYAATDRIAGVTQPLYMGFNSGKVVVGGVTKAYLIDATSHQITTLPFTTFPTAFGGKTAPLGAKAYMGLTNLGTQGQVAIFDLTAGGIAGYIPVGTEPFAMATHSGKLYVGSSARWTNGAPSQVFVVDPSTGTVNKAIDAGHVILDVVSDTVHNRAYALNGDDSTASVIDYATDTVTGTIPLGVSPRSGIIANGKLYIVGDVGSTQQGQVVIVDTATNTVTGSPIPTGRDPVTIGSIDSCAFITSQSDNVVNVLDLTTDSIVKTITVESLPTGLSSDTANRIVYVGNQGSNSISILSAIPSVAPAVTTAAANAVATTTATLNGTVNPNGSSTSYWFEYSTDSALTTFALTPQQSLGAGLNPLDVNWPVPGLSANTTYFFRIVAQNGAGTIKGSILSFATTAGAVSCNTYAATDRIAGVTQPLYMGFNIGKVIVGSVPKAYVIDAVSHQVTTLPFTTFPTAFSNKVALLGNKGYIALSNLGTQGQVATIDLTTSSIAGYTLVGTEPFAMAAHSGKLYVGSIARWTNGAPSQVFVVDPSTGSVNKAIDAGHVILDVVSDTVHNRAYALNGDDSTASVIDYATDTVTGTIPLGISPRSGIISNGKFYIVGDVGSTQQGQVVIVDTATNTVTGSPIPIGRDPVTIGSIDSCAFITSQADNVVNVLDLTTDSIVKTITVENLPTGLSIDTANRVVYVGNQGSNSISILGAIPSVAPAVTTAAANAVATTTATLNGTVNPNGSSTSYWFEYGTSSTLTTFTQTTPQLLSADATSANVNAGITGLVNHRTYYFRVVAANPGGTTKGAILNFVTTDVNALRFIPVTPCRVADTRNANGPFGGPFLGANTTRGFTIPSSACNIPAAAQAYSVNVTVVPHSTLGFLTMFPCGQPLPLASTLNSIDGRVKASAAIIPAGTNGSICAFVTNDTELVIDINGYFVPATDTAALAFYPVAPCRLVDTRLASGPLGGPSIASNSSRTLPVLSSSCNIPTVAQAYSLNFTVVPKGPLGFLTTWPAGQAQPLVSTLNANGGSVTANGAIVPAGTGGAISVFVTNDTDLVLDINGYFAPAGAGGLSLFNLAPCRVLDTRSPSGSAPFAGAINVNVTGSTCAPPTTAQSFVLNATVVPPASLGFLTLWPQGAPQPLVSTLNAIDGAVTSNMAIVPTTNGLVSAFAPNPTHLVLDISGYFAP